MSIHQPLNHVTFLQEWRDSLAVSATPANCDHTTSHSLSMALGRACRHASLNTVAAVGAPPPQSSSKTHGVEGGTECNAKHPDRYGKGATTPLVFPSLNALSQPLEEDGKVHMRNLYCNAKTGYMKCSYASNGTWICPHWVYGQCKWEDCIPAPTCCLKIGQRIPLCG